MDSLEVNEIHAAALSRLGEKKRDVEETAAQCYHRIKAEDEVKDRLAKIEAVKKELDTRRDRKNEAAIANAEQRRDAEPDTVIPRPGFVPGFNPARALARAVKTSVDAYADPSEPDMEPFGREVARLSGLKAEYDRLQAKEDARQVRETTKAEPDTLISQIPDGTEITLKPGTVVYVDKNGVALGGPIKGQHIPWWNAAKVASENYDPKGAAGSAKLPLSYMPPSAFAAVNAVFVLGAKKYGAYNYTVNRMKAMTYVNAIKRHLMEYECGGVIDDESNCEIMAHIMACASILIEQHRSGKLIDDRPAWTNPCDKLAGPYPAPKEEN